MQKVNASSQEKALAVELEDEMRLFDTVVRAHEETCDFTSDKVAPLLERARAHPIYTQCPPQLVSVVLVLVGKFPMGLSPEIVCACRGRSAGRRRQCGSYFGHCCMLRSF